MTDLSIMRIIRSTLLKIANDTVARRVRRDRGILSAYLCGSLLGEDYLLGGTVDIDLAFVHLDDFPLEREIVRLTDEVHLDLAHYSQRDFSQTRELRTHPWIGPTIFSCKILHDPQHFMDFTQASVRGQFWRADHVLARVRPQVDHARGIWMSFYRELPDQVGPAQVAQYLRALVHGVNAIAGLSGAPLADRRLLLEFPARAAAADRPGLHQGLLGMLGAPHVDGDSLRSWLPSWEHAITDLPASDAPARLHPDRLPYYRRALEAFLDGAEPLSALWLLLRTWTDAALLLPESTSSLHDWQAAFQALGMLGDGFSERVEALDAFLDTVEEALDAWAQANGAI